MRAPVTLPATLLAALLALIPSSGWAGCDPERVDFRGDFGTASFAVEIADDPDERATGLMNRSSMPMGQGMLFVYERPQSVAFWMHNTLIPLDMIFMDRTGRVTRVHENAVPLDDTAIPGGDGVLAVLEINGGLASRIGIEPGDVMRSAALDPAIAAWPCD